MDFAVQVKVATISLWNYAAIIVNVIAFIILYMKANRNASLKAFFLVQFAMLIWLIGKVFKTVSPTEDLRWAFIVFYYFGACLLEVTFLDFAYIYNKGKPMKKAHRIVIYFIALIQFIVVLTNPCHYLFYSRYSFWGDDFGILFYPYAAIYYIYMIIGMLYCSKKFRQQVKYKDPLQKYIIGSAILMPIIFNFIYITRMLESLFEILGIQVFDITPIVFTWSLLVFVYATFKYEFFDLTPIMKHEVTHRLDTPILIMDAARNIIFVNEQLKHSFEISDDYQKLKELINHKEMKKNSTDNYLIKYNDKYFKYSIKTLKGIGGIQYIVTFNDITSYQIVRNQLHNKNVELNEANKKLENQIQMLKETSRIGARNYVARELHDIIGHSLVVTMKLLEVSKIFYKKNTERVLESLEKARQSVKNGFSEMKEITTRKDNHRIYSSTLLEGELKSMLKVVEVSGMKVNFYLRGKADKLDGKVFDIIKKVSTELVTNTLKHAKASSILLSLNFLEREIHVQFMDNGIGNKKIKKGNGLKGIDSRLELIEGRATYEASSGEGFIANIKIPVK